MRTIHDIFPTTGPDLPIAFFLAKLPPLPPGYHRIAFGVEMSARHCDGLGSDPAVHCLGAGATRLGTRPFTVVARNVPASRPLANKPQL